MFPFTMQTFAVFCSLLILGGKRGTAAIGLYLFMGLIGLPVFSGFRGGIAHLIGPTGGYLIGFLFSGIIYTLWEPLLSGRKMLRWIVLALSQIVCYLIGTLWFITIYIRIKTAPGSKYGTVTEKPEIIFDSIEYNWSEKKTTFYLYDEVVGEIITEYYIFTAPAKKKVELTGDIYHFVSVLFEESGRSYDYLCDDKSVTVGDLVVVNGYDGEKTVKVVAVSDKYESELGIPIEKYKRIVRKV